MPEGARRRLKTRSKTPSRYYRISIVMGILFVAGTMALPLVIDLVRRSQDRKVVEETSPEKADDNTTIHAPKERPQRRENPVACRHYVYQRCNALNLPPSACATAVEAANAVPAGASLDACRTAVEEHLRDAVRAQETPRDEPDVLQAEDTAQVVVAAQTDIPKETQKEVQPVQIQKPPGLSPAERAVLAERMRVLVEEIQRAQTSRDYTMTPAALLARIEELRQIVQADGSDEAKAIYEGIRRQREPPPLQSDVSGSIGHSPYEAPTTTPEIEAAQRILDRARREAGLPPAGHNPQPAPTSLSPSEVPVVTSTQP